MKLSKRQSLSNAMPKPEHYLSVKEVASLLHVRPSTIYRWRYNGLGPLGDQNGETNIILDRRNPYFV